MLAAVACALLAAGAESFALSPVRRLALPALRAAPSPSEPDARVKFLEEAVGVLLRENDVLRRRVANFEAGAFIEPVPLWALEDWAAVEGADDCRDLGKERLTNALSRYNEAHPKQRRRVDGGLDQLAAELAAVLPALKQSAAAKAADGAKRRVLVEAVDTGLIAEGRVVSGTVARTTAAGVQVELATPFGTYTALLRPAAATGVEPNPSVAFLGETFPVGGEIWAEVDDVVINKDSSAVLLSTAALETSLGEMTSDKPAVYARGAARMEAQPAPMNSKERKRRQLEEVDAYLSVIDEFGAPEEARFY